METKKIESESTEPNWEEALDRSWQRIFGNLPFDTYDPTQKPDDREYNRVGIPRKINHDQPTEKKERERPAEPELNPIAPENNLAPNPDLLEEEKNGETTQPQTEILTAKPDEKTMIAEEATPIETTPKMELISEEKTDYEPKDYYQELMHLAKKWRALLRKAQKNKSFSTREEKRVFNQNLRIEAKELNEQIVVKKAPIFKNEESGDSERIDRLQELMRERYNYFLGGDYRTCESTNREIEIILINAGADYETDDKEAVDLQKQNQYETKIKKEEPVKHKQIEYKPEEMWQQNAINEDLDKQVGSSYALIDDDNKHQVAEQYLPRDPQALNLAIRWKHLIAQTLSSYKENSNEEANISKKNLNKDWQKLEQDENLLMSEENRVTNLNNEEKEKLKQLTAARRRAFWEGKFIQTNRINNQIIELVAAKEENPHQELPRTKTELKKRLAAEKPAWETFGGWVEENSQAEKSQPESFSPELPPPIEQLDKKTLPTPGKTDLGDREIIYDKEYEFVAELKNSTVRVKMGILEVGRAENVIFEIEDGAMVAIKEPKPESDNENERNYGALSCVFTTYGSGDIDIPKKADLGQNALHHKQ